MPYAPDAILFDGTTDFQLRGADLTGIADVKTGILSFWFRIDGGDGTSFRFLDNAQSRLLIRRPASNVITVRLRNAAGTDVLTMNSANVVAGVEWRHCLMSWDLAAGSGFLFIDDQDDTRSLITSDDAIDYTQTNWSIGASVGGVEKYLGAMSDLYFSTEFLDISLEVNRRKFIDADGIAVYLGNTGELPTGTAAIIYTRGILTDQGVNSGTGGDFVSQATQVPGETTGPTEPDPGNASVPYLPAGILFDGTTDFMLRGADLTGIVDGKKGTISLWLKSGFTADAQLLDSTNSRFVIQLLGANGRNQIIGRNSVGTAIIFVTAEPDLSDDEWHHYLASWDLNVPTVLIYIDDVSAKVGGGTEVDDFIDYTALEWSVGSNSTGVNLYPGALSDLFFDARNFIDLTVEANRRKFITTGMDPVFVGDDGTLPFGEFPEIYLPGTKLDQGFNGGSGGDFVSQGVQVPGEVEGPGQPGPLPGGPGDNMRHLARRTGRFHRFFRG